MVIVDQLDALASLVDLTSDRLNNVLDFIAQCTKIPQVSVVCSCREFEFRHDTRFTGLNAGCIDLQLPPWELIAEQLQKAGIHEAEAWPTSFREILRTPQHLQIYLQRFKETGKREVFGSYQSMLDDLWDRKLKTEQQRAFVYSLASYLIEHETLWAPLVCFESDAAVIDALEREDIVQRHKRQLGFRHQTLLEHAKARLFTKSHWSLCDHVLARQTAILVRPTLWAVLGYLREADSAKYHKELETLLGSQLRLHIRYLLIDFLGQVPEPDVVEVIQLTNRLSHPEDRIRALLAIRGSEKWFAALRPATLPAVMGWKAEDQWPMIGIISQAWKFAPSECIKLINDWWLPDPAKDGLTWQALRDIDRWDQQSVDMICRVIRRATEGGDRLWWAEDIVYKVSADQPKLAPQVFLAIADREDSTLKAEGAGHQRSPLETANDWYKLPDVAGAAPLEFLQAAWPWFVSTAVKLHGGYVSSVVNHYAGDLPVLDRDSEVVRPVIEAILISVTETAKADPLAFLEITQSSKSIDNGAVQRVSSSRVRGCRDDTARRSGSTFCAKTLVASYSAIMVHGSKVKPSR